MTTTARWLRDLLRWWLDELVAMCPEPVLRRMRRKWPVVTFDGSVVRAADGSMAIGRAVVLLPAAMALVRRMAMPPMSPRDLVAAVAMAGDRLMPLPAPQMLLAIGDGPAILTGDGLAEIAIGGISRAGLAPALAGMAATGVTAEALIVRSEGQRFDFLSAARAAKLIENQLSATVPWWALVGLLVLLNMATLIWREMDGVAALQAQVDARRPIAEGALRAARRIQAGVLVAQDQAQRRRSHDPLRALALITATLPAEAWVQRWAWDGQHVRIAGYVRGPLDVVRVLRDSHRFADVRNAASEVQGEIPTGRPFDILITMWGG